jgi:mutator protein MutT
MSGAESSSIERVEIAVAVLEHDGEFLIGQRPEGSSLAGYWEFPGGKVEPGESAADAARRECLEETGLDVYVVDEYLVVEHDYAHAKVRLHFCRCTPCARQRQLPLPQRFRWAPGETLGEYEFPAANEHLLAKLAQSVRTR